MKAYLRLARWRAAADRTMTKRRQCYKIRAVLLFAPSGWDDTAGCACRLACAVGIEGAPPQMFGQCDVFGKLQLLCFPM